MVDDNIPDINKCVMDPPLFWESFDHSGATEKASIFYLRAPWSFFEPEEGQFAWDDPSSNYYALVQGALDRGLKLSFRVYMDSQNSWQQVTPQYVIDAGAKGYNNNGYHETLWTPYINDAVFLDKFTKFIAAFGEKYNDPSKVDFVDAMGLGAWGEGHNIRQDSSQPGNVNTSVKTIATAYEKAFDKVLKGGQQGGALANISESLVDSNHYDIFRRDSFGMPQYFGESDKAYYVNRMLGLGIPVFAENGWNYFAHDFEKYMNQNGNPFSSIRELLEVSLRDAKDARANTFDLRVPEDAAEWMKNEDLVDDFIVNGGYRFVPTNFTFPTTIQSSDYVTVTSEWKNTALGKMPNNRPAWGYKYKVAFALLDTETALPVFTHVTNIDPSDWLKGRNYMYESNISFGDIPNGTYDFAYGIVDTTNNNEPAINLAITEEKTNSGWYKMGKTTVSNIAKTPANPDFSSYRLAEDWSSVQGKNQWYYLEGNDSNYSEMTWNDSGNSWKGTHQYNVIRGNAHIHPDNKDSVVGWKASTQGDITISGNPRKHNIACGDGVNIKIMKNDTQLWPAEGWQHIEAADNAGIDHELTTTVKPNDMIYFVVNKKDSNSCDGMVWNPFIEYGSQADSIDVAPQATVSTTMGTSIGSIANIIKETGSWSSANSVTFPGYITLDLGDKHIHTNKITLSTHYGKGQGITNFDIEYHNGTDWVPAKSDVQIQWDMNSNVIESKDVTFDPIYTNKIRLKVKDGNLDWGHIALNQLQWWSAGEGPNEPSAEVNTAEMLSTLKDYQGDVAEKDYRALNIHLTAVGQFEKKEEAAKVVKHLENFQKLLDHQLASKAIPQELYDTLKADTKKLMEQWK
ncbi:FIMAH domain-containing protein [Bacillus niameyensis]|uniref:FIMAH domain-containing protein n=1 Tax=Bacillus niameyensis TaxID=1522308 RepID=UPI0007837E67|nr:hypothetical protein [Bacillus niameyensis]